MESLLKELINIQLDLLTEQRQTNQLLTMLIEALAGDDVDTTPTHDMDGNPI